MERLPGRHEFYEPRCYKENTHVTSIQTSRTGLARRRPLPPVRTAARCVDKMLRNRRYLSSCGGEGCLDVTA
ncbi:hypothetical protein HPB50_005961 [Hyalomma asiaticum]|uniref:Uncharacterized protein n=1 Tax=Hyalomma asiaticum TaxID=266040 RepID=A0ACB7S5M8_HYAAI|nr:hypothetical protein HPB50_005961 [Hyalomma asiaticum]